MVEFNKSYKHYKGTTYHVICLAKDADSLEPVVVYQNPENFEVWVRPEKEWDDIIDEAGTKRFTLIED